MNGEFLARRISERMKALGLSAAELGVRSLLTEKTIYNVLNQVHRRAPNRTTVDAICRALGIDPKTGRNVI